METNKPIDIGDRCVWCGEDTSVGSGRWVNRLGVETTADTVAWLPDNLRKPEVSVSGWSCADCAGYECDKCGEQIYLDTDVWDKNETGHFHPECLPLDEHWIDPEETKCGCGLHEDNCLISISWETAEVLRGFLGEIMERKGLSDYTINQLHSVYKQTLEEQN